MIETRLIIDTCSSLPALILSCGGQIVDKMDLEGQNNLSESLLQKIDRLLQKNHRKITDLSAVEVKAGPGSYTGLRIALTTANFIAYSLNIPVSEDKSSSSKKFVSPVMPIYYQPPLITKKRSRL